MPYQPSISECQGLLREHHTKLKEISSENIDRRHQVEFPSWLRTWIQEICSASPDDVSNDIYALACGLDLWVYSYSACIMNGIRFHTRKHGEFSATQNSGVVVQGEHRLQPVNFYGVLIDILQLCHMGWHHVYLFRCDWFDIGDRRRVIHVGDHLTSVNTTRKWYKDEPFALTCQASQVFYLKDTNLGGNWSVVQKITSRNVHDVPTMPMANDDVDDEENLNVPAFQENDPSYVKVVPECDDDDTGNPLHRIDVEPTHLAEERTLQHTIPFADDEEFINDEEDENDDNHTHSSEDILSDSQSSSDDESDE